MLVFEIMMADIVQKCTFSTKAFLLMVYHQKLSSFPFLPSVHTQLR